MRSTKSVLDALRAANPSVVITEDRVRHLIRRGGVTPTSFAGRLAWSRADVARLAEALNLTPPELDDERGGVLVA